MTKLDRFLEYAESHRFVIHGVAAVLIFVIAWLDWLVPNFSVGFLYLLPVLLSSATLNTKQIVGLALFCAYMREAFDPLQSNPVNPLPFVWNPLHWAPGTGGRLLVIATGFTMTGFFVAELNQRRQLLGSHLKELKEQVQRREEAEMRLRILIETSPLAILTLDRDGRVLLSNKSAGQLLGFDQDSLEGEQVAPYLPILNRLLHSDRSGKNMRTSVECRGNRRSGEVFLAHVWLSTYRTSQGPGLAAVVWDASENLRDREGSGLDSMMATSRVLIGAISHEIRNLASAAASAYSALAETPSGRLAGSEHYQALGTLIGGLEKIASSGLRVASDREAAVADMGTVLDETRVVIEPAFKEAGIRVAWEVPGNLPLVQADRHSLLQVFINLARNSLRALEQSEHKEVRISAALECDLVVVRFRDSGPGVPHPDELFRPFQQGSQAVGLGLYISRAILRAHGGGLRYEPEDSGSCFAVELWPVENQIEG